MFSRLKAPTHLRQEQNSLTLPLHKLSCPVRGGSISISLIPNHFSHLLRWAGWVWEGRSGKAETGQIQLRKVQVQKRSAVMVYWGPTAWEPRVSLTSSEGAISTQLLASFQTVLRKASRLSLTNLAGLIYSRERSCRGMCWQTHGPVASATITK